MGEHAAVGRPPDRPAGLEHRGLEPAAVLVGALQVEVGEPVLGAVRPVAQHEGVGGAGVEPHVEDVGDHVPILGVVVGGEEAGLGAVLIPGVGALLLEGREDAGVDGLVAQQEALVLGPDLAARVKAGQRHAPGALARQHPVGAAREHRMQAVAARARREGHQFVGGAQGALADGRAVSVEPVAHGAVDGGEPLRAVEPDDGRLRAPGMGVRDGDAGPGEQRAHLHQLVDDGAVGAAGLAVGLHDRLAPEEGEVRSEGPVALDVVGHRQAVAAADLVVVLAVRGRGVDEAGARVVGDVIAGEEGDVVVPTIRRSRSF